MCRTIKIFISNWPRTRKFSQLLQAGKTVAFDFAHHGHALRPIFMLWLVKVWHVSSCEKFIQHLESCLLWQLKLTEFCVNLDVFNCLFPLDVQNEIQVLSGVFYIFMANLFIGFLVEKCFTCQSRKSGFGWHHFRFSPCLMRKRIEKSEAILTLLDTFQALNLEW